MLTARREEIHDVLVEAGGRGGRGKEGRGVREPPHRMSCQRDWQSLDVVAKEKISACGGKNLDGFRVLKFTVSWM